MNKIVLAVISLILSSQSFGQDKVHRVFNSTRVINAHSTETLDKHELDFKISHRFGDIGGDNGGGKTAFGLDNVADVRIAFEYGISNKLNVGFGRSKGSGPYSQLLDGYLKYSILEQTTDNKMPLSITLLGGSSYDMQDASTNENSPTSYTESTHRFAFVTELLISRKFSDKFSMQLMPAYVHRNYVAFDDENGVFSVGGAARLKMSKLIAILGEYHYNVGDRSVTGLETQNPFGVGIEFDTGGHVFQMNFTNSRGLGETQFIPYTLSDVSKGQFRWGFTVSRVFKLKRKKVVE